MEQLSGRPVVAILGGGVAGAATAFDLARALPRGAAGILVVEPRDTLGPGLAYSTTDPAHRTNVPASKMSLLGSDQGHFMSWLAATRTVMSPGTLTLQGEFFPERHVFGAYVAAQLAPPGRWRGPPRALERRRREPTALDGTWRTAPAARSGAELRRDEHVALREELALEGQRARGHDGPGRRQPAHEVPLVRAATSWRPARWCGARDPWSSRRGTTRPERVPRLDDQDAGRPAREGARQVEGGCRAGDPTAEDGDDRPPRKAAPGFTTDPPLPASTKRVRRLQLRRHRSRISAPVRGSVGRPTSDLVENPGADAAGSPSPRRARGTRRPRPAPRRGGHHPVGEVERLPDVVGDKHRGEPVLAPDAVQQAMHLAAGERVERAEGRRRARRRSARAAGARAQGDPLGLSAPTAPAAFRTVAEADVLQRRRCGLAPACRGRCRRCRSPAAREAAARPGTAAGRSAAATRPAARRWRCRRPSPGRARRSGAGGSTPRATISNCPAGTVRSMSHC